MNSNEKLLNPFELVLEVLNRIESIVTEIKRKGDEGPRTSMEKDEGDGIALAMRITGLKKKSIYNLVSKRLIPHSKKGKKLYFDEKELEEWKRSGKRMTIDELHQATSIGELVAPRRHPNRRRHPRQH